MLASERHLVGVGRESFDVTDAQFVPTQGVPPRARLERVGRAGVDRGGEQYGWHSHVFQGGGRAHAEHVDRTTKVVALFQKGVATHRHGKDGLLKAARDLDPEGCLIPERGVRGSL